MYVDVRPDSFGAGRPPYRYSTRLLQRPKHFPPLKVARLRREKEDTGDTPLYANTPN
jgi:hypothetical protein